MSEVITFSRNNSQPEGPPDDLTERNDKEMLELLLDAIAKATPAQRLTLLTLIEHPDALDAVEKFWIATKAAN